MATRIPLNGLASQELVEAISGQATDASVKAGSTVLVFSDSRLAIENPFVLKSACRTLFSELVGTTISEAFSTDDEICLTFEDGDQLLISLRDVDFTGPEAAVYSPNGGPIVVFN